MPYFLVTETHPAAARDMGNGTYSEDEEVVIIRGFVEAKDVSDMERLLRLGSPAKDGSYRLTDGSFLRLKRIERLQWLAHPGVKAE